MYGTTKALWSHEASSVFGCWLGHIQEETMANYTNFVGRVYGDRSFGEGKLVELLGLCWEPDPSKRIDIFEVIRFLGEAITDNDSFGKQSDTN